MIQQETNGTFNYAEFKRRVDEEDLTPMQRGPLNQRLDTLESFMPQSQVPLSGQSEGQGKGVGRVEPRNHRDNGSGTDWTIKVCGLQIRTLTVYDIDFQNSRKELLRYSTSLVRVSHLRAHVHYSICLSVSSSNRKQPLVV